MVEGVKSTFKLMRAPLYADKIAAENIGTKQFMCRIKTARGTTTEPTRIELYDTTGGRTKRV
jgi:hypothetical protein